MSTLERLFHSPAGQAVARRAGLAAPTELRRGRTWPGGEIALAELGPSRLGADTLGLVGRPWREPVVDATDGDDPPAYESPLGALVVDATDLRSIPDLERLRAVLRPAARALEPSGRVVVLARPTEAVDGWEARAVAQALDGLNRSVGKELRHGATATLLYVDPAADPPDLRSTLGFLLQGRSAFVDGQSWRVGPTLVPRVDERAAAGGRPLKGRLVVVTGAARGIGAAIARVLARDGADLVAVDVPAAGQALSAVTNEVRGTALQLDITSPQAGARIAAHVAERHGGASLFGIVHNAGITRDKLLVNTDAQRWRAVLDVNLAAEIAINEVLLDPGMAGGLAEGGRIVGIASTSGIAGNRGQANYAASKAGVVGLVRAMAPELAGRGITVNAVAPGFIETEMTAKIPFVQREVFRRSNSLGQGGDPIDVAETIGYFLDPASGGVTGQVVRVCGQNLVGA